MEDFEVSEEVFGSGWERIPKVTESSGIVALVRKGEVVYLARSKRVYYRIGMHRAALDRHKSSRQADSYLTEGDFKRLRIAFDEVWVFFCPEEDLLRMEIEFLQRFRPKHNAMIPETLPDLKIDIHDLMAKVQCETKVKSPIHRRSL